MSAIIVASSIPISMLLMPSLMLAVPKSAEQTALMAASSGHIPVQDVFADYLCEPSEDANNACSPGPAYGVHLSTLLKSNGLEGTHILLYGPSWMQQIGSSLVAFSDVMKEEHLGDNEHLECYCGLRRDVCPCAGYARYHMRGGWKLTGIFNYGPLQASQGAETLRALLRTSGFTHALVMESHSDCFFNVCHGLRLCNGCERRPDYLGSEWQEEMWSMFETAFGQRMINVVPWSVANHDPIHGPAGVAVRTRAILESWGGCSAVWQENQTISSCKRGVTSEHQCYAMCNRKALPSATDESSLCREGPIVRLTHKLIEHLLGS